jgi:hypothetical protein
VSERARAILLLALLASAVVWTLPRAAHAAPPAKAQMGPGLRRLADVYERRGAEAARRLARLRRLRMRGPLVPVILVPARGVRPRAISARRIRALGGRVDAVSKSYVRVLVPLGALRRLETVPGIRAFREPDPAIELDTGLGAQVSESVELTQAAALQAGGLSGAGVRVAVIDLGFSGLGAAVAAGELPAATTSVDFTGLGMEAETAHGVAVAEHLADMAPGVELHLLKVGDVVDLENAAAYLRDHDIAIANHSVGWTIASYYDDGGPISAVVNGSREQDGVFWTVAAGNQARRHWRGAYADGEGNGWMDFAPGSDWMQLTSSSAQACVFLNWNQYGASLTDLDLFVYDATDEIAASSEFSQWGPQTPAESACFDYDPARAPYRVRVLYYSGPTAGVDATLFSFYNNLQHASAASSLMDPAAARGAFSVGAVHRSSWSLASPPVESFSSQGPTNDGRIKPDLVAPDGTSSLTYGPRAAFGTSFSAPTVAGAAALLLEEDPSLSADQLAAVLHGMALDIGEPGLDAVTGAGKLDLPPSVVFSADSDGDGVGDDQDNCLFAANPPIAPLAFQTTTGGQLDDDADGFGNACDADFDQNGGSIASTDFARLKAAFGHPRASASCPGEAPCDVYDLDGAGPAIDGADLAVFKALFGAKSGPRCPSCPRECAGDACP